MGDRDRCLKCSTWLVTEIERDYGICGKCADEYYDTYRRRKEWGEYHPSEKERE